MRGVLDMEASFPRGLLVIYAYVENGQFTDAHALIENWRRTDNSAATWAVEAYVDGRSGQQAKARRALKKFTQINERQHLALVPILAQVDAGMNNKDQARAWLQKAYLGHSGVVASLKVDPIYDPLRSDPRFQQLLRDVRLAQ